MSNIMPGGKGRKDVPKVRKAFDSKELEELGQELEAAKQKKRFRKASKRLYHSQEGKPCAGNFSSID